MTGVNLAGVKRILELRAEVDRLHRQLDEVRSQLAHRRAIAMPGPSVERDRAAAERVPGAVGGLGSDAARRRPRHAPRLSRRRGPDPRVDVGRCGVVRPEGHGSARARRAGARTREAVGIVHRGRDRSSRSRATGGSSARCRRASRSTACRPASSSSASRSSSTATGDRGSGADAVVAITPAPVRGRGRPPGAARRPTSRTPRCAGWPSGSASRSRACCARSCPSPTARTTTRCTPITRHDYEERNEHMDLNKLTMKSQAALEEAHAAGAGPQPPDDRARARAVRAARRPRGGRLPAAAPPRGEPGAAARDRSTRRSTRCRRSTRRTPRSGSRRPRRGCSRPRRPRPRQLTDEYVSTEHLLLAMLGDARRRPRAILLEARAHARRGARRARGGPRAPARHEPEPRGHVPGRSRSTGATSPRRPAPASSTR